MNRSAAGRALAFYVPYMWRFAVLRRPQPLIYGIVVTDRCNLACRGCEVANLGRRSMTWGELTEAMRSAWGRGYRELYFSGGEPMLWHDGEYTLEDAG